MPAVVGRSKIGIMEASVAQFAGTDLTPREREVLDCLSRGLTTSSIARELGISSATVRNHVYSILQKLGVHTRLAAVVLALRRRLI